MPQAARALLVLAVLAAGCASPVKPVPRSAAAEATPPRSSPSSSSTAPPPAAPAEPAPTTAPEGRARTVIRFDEDVGGPLPDGPELDVVDARKRASFKSLLDPKYQRDAGAAAAEPPSEK
jgi:hypothetical protein